MTPLLFIYSFFDTVINFAFNTFKLPQTTNVYFGWVLVAVISINITVQALLNLPNKRSINISVKSKGGTDSGQ